MLRCLLRQNILIGKDYAILSKMKYSKLFVKTLKEAPKDADTINHKLLTQAGFVDQLMAGVYSYLPLGLRVLRNIEQVVREEMDAIGGQEILMPILHPKHIWETTKGWDNIDVLFKIQSRTEKEYALGQSEEEVVTPLVMKHVRSYQQLPQAVYQIHWKYRDELRAKSGILRGREFFMKDMYSFHETQEDFNKFYEEAKQAYLKIYTRLGLIAKVTEASGGSFSEKISYEFMILTDAGEDDILYCTACEFCVNVEIAKIKEGAQCPKCKKAKLKKARASEAGNVFDLGQKYSKDFELTASSKDGKQIYPIMGCYGIGISRVMGLIVEKYHDDRGIIWPQQAAPFQVHVISLKENHKADKIYKKLQEAGIDVLYDDREDVSAGAKFADADLIGIPVRLVVSAKTGEEIEWKQRNKSETELVSMDTVLRRLGKVDLIKIS
jgi:prolyl-tRNA synthetase